MITGSTESFLALQDALRRQQQVMVQLPQQPAFPAVVTAVSHAYADLRCSGIGSSDSQLGLVRISFPFRNSSFSLTTSARRLSPTLLRIDTDSQGERVIQDSVSFQGKLVAAAEPPRLPRRPRLQRLHPLLHATRDELRLWAEHRVSILPAPIQAEKPVIHSRLHIPSPPTDYCLPIVPTPEHGASENQKRFDITAPIQLGEICFGSIDVISVSAHPADYGLHLSRLSVCAAAIAHELLYGRDSTGSDSPQLQLLLNTPTGALLFSPAAVRDTRIGFRFPTPSGYCFTLPW